MKLPRRQFLHLAAGAAALPAFNADEARRVRQFHIADEIEKGAKVVKFSGAKVD
jgi:hypothetical protein